MGGCRAESPICLSNIRNQFLVVARCEGDKGRHTQSTQGRHCQISPLNIQTVNMAIKSINNQWAATSLIRSHPIFTCQSDINGLAGTVAHVIGLELQKVDILIKKKIEKNIGTENAKFDTILFFFYQYQPMWARMDHGWISNKLFFFLYFLLQTS